MHVDHTKNIIELKDVSFSYDGKNNILEDINLNVHKGDYLGIIGPNGGGKTTILKIMLGLLKPAHGTVCLTRRAIDATRRWLGWTVSEWEERRSICSGLRPVVTRTSCWARPT